MRKRGTIVLAVLLSFALLAAACGDDEPETVAEPEPAPAEPEPAPEPEPEPEPEDDGHEEDDGHDHDEDEDGHEHEDEMDDISVGLVFDIGGRGDQSFNDSAAAGIERAAAELGITFTEASPGA